MVGGKVGERAVSALFIYIYLYIYIYIYIYIQIDRSIMTYRNVPSYLAMLP